MAGFLFKKQKQETGKGPIVIGTPTTLQSAPTPPVYARFTSSAAQGGTDGRQASRKVSGPAPLTSPSRSQSQTTDIGAGKHGYSTASLASDRRRGQEQQFMQSTARRKIAESQLPRPLSREILDKPLPPPAPPKDDEDLNARRMVMNRMPPSSFPAQQPQNTRGRVSLDYQPPKESRLPPRPGSAQAYYPSSTSGYPSSPSRTNAASSPTWQNGPSSPSANRKIRPSPSPFGEKVLPTPQDSTLVPSPTRMQDFSSDRPYRNGTVNAYSSIPAPPTASSSQTLYTDVFSEPPLDLPPEAALFQEYGEILSVPSQPNSLSSRQGLPPENSGDNVGFDPPGMASASPSARNGHFQTSYHQAPQPASPVKPSSPRRPLPSPPPNNMGNSPSSPSGSTVFSSAYHDLYPAHVLVNMNGQYDDRHGVSQSPPQASVPYNQSIGRSTSPPLPPGAGLPAPFPEHTTHNVDQSSPSPKKPPRPSGDKRSTPDRAQTLVPQQQQLPPASLRKSPSMQYPSMAPVTRGKPRIFAAMETEDPQPTYTSPTAIPAPEVFHQPQPVLNPLLSRPTSHVHPGEAFVTPKSDFEPLPESYPNDNTYAPDQHPSTSPNTTTPSPMSPPILATEPPTPTPPFAPAPEVRSRKRTNSRSINRHSEDPTKHLQPVPHTPPRSRKLSKARQNSETSFGPLTHANGSAVTLSGMSDGGHNLKPHRTKYRPTTPNTNTNANTETGFEPITQVDEETVRNAGIPLDDDPFAKTEGVRMLKPTSPSKRSGKSKEPATPSEGTQRSDHERSDSGDVSHAAGAADDAVEPTAESPSASEEVRKHKKEKKDKRKPKSTPVEPDVDPTPREPITMLQLLMDVPIFSCLLDFLSFYEWCLLLALSKEIRLAIVRNQGLREVALERFLKTVGYARWCWEDKEPLSLSLQDLSDYMRGVSTPTHEYARVAGMYIHSLRTHPNNRDPSLIETVQRLTASTRAYNRVLLRLRAQAEKEASLHPSSSQQIPTSKSGQFSSSNRGGGVSRASSRAPSPTMSSNSHSNGHLPGTMQATTSQISLAFKSPLFRLRRAPLLRVFVPSPEGDWLSDKSVLECEAECRRAGVQPLMRIGDVVWDVAVGDEGNVGRLVWDGSYLIDLDYTYSPTGDLPKYLPALAFPPSYFHRVIRTGHTSSNPIIHVDISPWGEEIAMNLQLLQDRVKTETPQGAYHNVMRWVHRSSFQVRLPRGPPRHQHTARNPNNSIPIPDTDNLTVDPGWYGTIVVETEGTNEALADLQDRCGPGAFPPRPRGVTGQPTQLQIENRKVFRVLREKSRPGEIWIRAVGIKERLL